VKYRATFPVTLLCITYLTHPMEQENQINTKGIIPLFDSSNEFNDIERFKWFHERIVNHINEHALLSAQTEEEYNQFLFCAKDCFKQLRNQCRERGSEKYLTELIGQHETKRQNLLQKAEHYLVQTDQQRKNLQLGRQLDESIKAIEKERIQLVRHIPIELSTYSDSSESESSSFDYNADSSVDKE
jgi:hypothetical protein